MALRIIWFIVLIVLPMHSLFSQQNAEGQTTIEGSYQGKNLFVRNPYIPDEKKFCIIQIFVNEAPLGNLPRTSAIQIDLSHLALNAPVSIRVVHNDSCQPLVVNPEVIQQSRSFQFLYVQVDDNAVSWITTGESPEGVFELERRKWEGWFKVKEIEGKGELDNNQYSIDASHYSGNNVYRLTYANAKGETFTSEEVTFYSLLEPVKMFPGKEVYDWISLSRPTDYKIYTDLDTLVLKGFGDEINVSSLDYGDYYIILEDEPLDFTKPRPEIIPRKRKRGQKENENGRDKQLKDKI